MAKKIQSGEIEGRIVTNEGNEVEIIRFNLTQNSFPILAIIRIPSTVTDYWEDAKLFQFNGKHGNEKICLEIELIEETPKHELKSFDKVLVRDNSEDKWIPDIFRYYDDNYPDYPYRCCANDYKYCIPYEGNKYLLGTTKNPK